jgi:hypothetical protein
LWPARFYKILPIYFINSKIFEKKLLNTKRSFLNFFYNFCQNISHFNENWGRYDLSVKHPLFLSDFNETWTSSTDIRKIIKYRITWKSACGNRAVPCGQTEGRTDRQKDLTKITVVFCNFANAPRNYRSHCFAIFFPLCLFYFSRVFSILCTYKPLKFIDVIFIQMWAYWENGLDCLLRL